MNFQQFQPILGGTVISDARDGKFFLLPPEKEDTAVMLKESINAWCT